MTRFSIALMLLTSVLLGGCQFPGFAAANLLPQKQIPAAYEPIDQTTLVLVDDPGRQVPSLPLLAQVAASIGGELERREVITRFVAPGQVQSLRFEQSGFSDWPIDRVGRELGAEQVIYVLIDGFDPAASTLTLSRPIASARIRVVQVAGGQALFPLEGEHSVLTMLDYHQSDTGQSTHGDDTLLARRLAERLGRDIAEQFFKHKPREIGSGFDG